MRLPVLCFYLSRVVRSCFAGLRQFDHRTAALPTVHPFCQMRFCESGATKTGKALPAAMAAQ